MSAEQMWDVAVVGGGSAGLSAALTLARARRSVLVIDGGEPRNAPAAAAHGLLGLEGINPVELLAKGREEAAAYGAEFISGSVVEASGSVGEGFTVSVDSGSTVRAGQLLLATGVRDELPDLPGLVDRWGREVVHCPYCHGWEIRDQRIGLLATSPMSAMKALLFHQWSDEVVLLAHGTDVPAEQMEKLAALGIAVIPDEVREVEVAADQLTGVRLVGGSKVELDALAVSPQTHARMEGLEGLGVDMAENPMGVGVAADGAGHTSVPGVWAAGNITSPAMQVSEAAANGARVAMTLNVEMIFARAEKAVANVS